MSGKTAIGWTSTSHADGTVTPGSTWNTTVGCTRVTAGCDGCYAFALHDRRHAIYQANDGRWSPEGEAMPAQYAHPFSEIQILPERLELPLHWKKPRRIFVDSVSDLFHSQIPDDHIQAVFDVMRRAHWHTFQVLTKRPGRLRRMASQLHWAPNIWMGVSIERDELTPRADALRLVEASVRFLSLEPLLGPLPSLDLRGISWAITGGESGPNARPCDPDWVRAIRDRCQAAGVAFFHKQNGGRTPKSGGRLLDGRTWDEFPVVGRQEVHA
jgi:protein gp37